MLKLPLSPFSSSYPALFLLLKPSYAPLAQSAWSRPPEESWAHYPAILETIWILSRPYSMTIKSSMLTQSALHASPEKSQEARRNTGIEMSINITPHHRSQPAPGLLWHFSLSSAAPCPLPSLCFPLWKGMAWLFSLPSCSLCLLLLLVLVAGGL